jgi:predicted lipid-binding transport protein (Tim44 family)
MDKRLWMVGMLAVALVGSSLPDLAEAKRFGGGGSSGMQRNMPQRTAPATPPKPAQPAAAPTNPAQQAAPGAAGAAAPAAAAGRSWMGPLAGLAAGLGIAALMSHLGLGAAFGNFLMLALLLVGGFFLVRFLMRRFGGGQAATGMNRQQPAFAGAGAGAGTAAGGGMARPSAPVFVDERPNRPDAAGVTPAEPLLRAPMSPQAPAASGFTPPGQVPAAELAPVVAPAFVPASFDSEGFARIAKAIFIRMQTANDAGDLDDLRRFTTPEMFAEVRLELQDRGATAQHTDVLSVDAEVLDVAQEDGRQIVSVRYRGQLREQAEATPVDFDEIWHLAKPDDDSRGWAIAGIEQSH